LRAQELAGQVSRTFGIRESQAVNMSENFALTQMRLMGWATHNCMRDDESAEIIVYKGDADADKPAAWNPFFFEQL
jgi:hypothetical protein